jgi:hypothetical protein
MPQIKVTQAFSYWHNGHSRRDYEPGADPVDTDDECAAVAIAEGWAVEPGSKAKTAAPENKDAAPKREKKAAA